MLSQDKVCKARQCVCVFFFNNISCRSLGDNLSLVTWPWPGRQRGKGICLYSEASSRLRASPAVLFKGYWRLLSQRWTLLAGLEGARSPSCCTEVIMHGALSRSPICFHGVFKGRVPFCYGLESLTFTLLKKGAEQGYDRRGPTFHRIRHCR